MFVCVWQGRYLCKRHSAAILMKDNYVITLSLVAIKSSTLLLLLPFSNRGKVT